MLIIDVVCKILLSIELHLLLSAMYHFMTSMIILGGRGSSVVHILIHPHARAIPAGTAGTCYAMF